MITLDHLRQALALPGFDAPAAQLHMAPQPRGLNFPMPRGTDPRLAAVLVLLYPCSSTELGILLTRRTEKLSSHSGQISFPGGKRDETDASFEQTALREACEELGLCAEDMALQLLGQLERVYIPPSHFEVYPIVAAVPALPALTLAADEVAEVLTLPLNALLHPATRQHVMREFFGQPVSVPYYAVQGHQVWGATAAMLSELEHRLRAVVPPALQAAIAAR